MNHTVENRDGMTIEWDAPIAMDDGLVLRADIFRPMKPGRFPVIMSYGPYGKGVSFQEGYKTAWDIMARENPDAVSGTSNRYANWEVVDPEKWVPDDYVCIRVDSRGAGRSPGYLCHNNERENRDYHLCIEWAAAQDWCTGKVGLNGISYFAASQWRAAATQPPHLAAICVWEGWADNYRDGNHHGGIACTFRKNWQDMQVKTVQHGVGSAGRKSPVTGEWACGPETLDSETLVANRENMWAELVARQFDEAYYRERSADLGKVTVPLLSAANWGGHGLHARGNFEGFIGAASTQKWLEVHSGSHWAPFYTDYGVGLQKRFFNYFLKGQANGWDAQPRVQLNVRQVGGTVLRFENEWPLARTQWTDVHLNPAGMSLSRTPFEGEAQVGFEAMGEGVTFLSEAFQEDTEITGPSALALAVSSSTQDADIFAVLRLFDPEGKEVVFQGALDPNSPLAHGWLRVSHRELDEKKSLPWRPYHTHARYQPLAAGQIVDVQVEIWPTCIVLPKGYRLGLSLRGKDYVYDGAATTLSNMKNPMRGCGPFEHDDDIDRPAEIFGGITSLHFGQGLRNTMVVPVIPPAKPPVEIDTGTFWP
ncbi:MAG: CocE/NonD family hydrolase [Pseudomonadota bacterium]